MSYKKTLILFSLFMVLLIVVLVIEKPFQPSTTRKAADEVSGLFPRFQADKAARITIKQIPDLTFELVKGNTGWTVASLNDVPASTTEIEEVFKKISEFTNADVRSTNPENQALFEVNNMGIEVDIKNDTGESLAHFFVGKNGPTFTDTYVRVADSNAVTLQKGYLKPIFDKSRYNWRNRDIITFDANNVDTLVLHKTIEHGKKKEKVPHEITLQRAVVDNKEIWKMITPEELDADEAEVKRIVSTLSMLKADEFVDGKTFAEVGLEQPEQWVEITFKDGLKQTLLIGPKDKNNHIVALAGSEYIYQISEFRVTAIFKEVDDLKKKDETPQLPDQPGALESLTMQ